MDFQSVLNRCCRIDVTIQEDGTDWKSMLRLLAADRIRDGVSKQINVGSTCGIVSKVIELFCAQFRLALCDR